MPHITVPSSKRTNAPTIFPLIRLDKVEIGIQVVHMGCTSFVMELQIRDARGHERIFAHEKTVMVWCNYRTGRLYRMPSVLRSALERKKRRAFPLEQ